MGISFHDVEENQLMSQDVLDCIPHTCECGAPVEFTDSLRQIYCTNPKCFYKVAARLEAMAKKLRGPNGETCDGWGESACITVCKEFNLVSPFQVFQLEKFINSDFKSAVPAFDKKVKSICDRRLRKVELWKVAELAGIPSVESISYKIFGGYSDFTKAFEDIEAGQVPFIANKLGLRGAETSVMAVNVYNTLMQYKYELLFGEKQFDIYQPTGKTLYMCITGCVNGFRNKGEFVQYINNRYDGKVNAMLMNSVTTQVEILVADGDASSNKFKTATRLNKKYIEKGLSTGEFISQDLGKLRNRKDLHPVGEMIFIGSSTDVIERLDRVFGGDD